MDAQETHSLAESQKAHDAFWKALFRAVKYKGALTKGSGENGAVVNGQHLSLSVTSIRAKNSYRWKFSWSGALQVGLSLGYRAGQKTWRSKKDGSLPIDEIADACIEHANRMIRQEDAEKTRDARRASIESSALWKQLKKRLKALKQYTSIEHDGEGSVQFEIHRVPLEMVERICTAVERFEKESQ